MTGITTSIRVAPRIAEALDGHRPVVALETTLVTHGLPRPQGLEAALKLEQLVREGGATPASIGVLDGALRVGLETAELERLAGADRVAKLNPGNLAAAIATGASGSTTVAATLIAAAAVGIRVFATGGIGGVHRGASETGDISSDLMALAGHPVAVVSAGAKAVLDLPRTVEMLETLGVPVYGYGTDEFPAFYRRASGLPVDARFDALEPLAAAIRAHWALGLRTAVLVGNPVPPEHELPEDLLAAALAEALGGPEGARAKNAPAGRDVTPHLLERLRVLTAGRSVTTNLALLENNARIAASLAVALAG